jgi:hypothetical protein
MAVTSGVDNKLLRAASFVLLALGILSVVVALLAATLGRRLAARPAQKRLAQYIALAALIVLALLAPWWVENVPHFSLLKLSVAITFMMVILGLNLLTGFGGQISLGHSAFAIGGYTTAHDQRMGHLLGLQHPRCRPARGDGRLPLRVPGSQAQGSLPRPGHPRPRRVRPDAEVQTNRRRVASSSSR